MPFLFVQENIIQALCRTLVHSLWQGLFAAAVAGIIIMATKRSKAAIRYNLLSFVFIGFIITSCLTFLLQPGILYPVYNAGDIIRFVPDANDNAIAASTGNNWLPALNKYNFYQSIIFFTDKYSAVITGTWLLFFCLHLLRMFTGLHYAHRIRFYKTNQPAEEWKQRLQQVAELLGIRETVSLMESAIIKVPVVTGFLKPMILVPVGMLANLSVQQVETILLHELAHVRRKDFLINLLQRLAESLFFFNPFIAWISARIREEREACCDDIVIEYATDKRSYLEALVSFREADTSSYSPAMSLGQNNKLLYRVKRMITQENKKLNAMEKLTLILILTAATAVSFMPAGKESGKQNDPNKKQLTALPQQEQLPVISFAAGIEMPQTTKQKDTLPGKENLTFQNISSVNNDDGKNSSSAVTTKASNGKTYSYRIENGEITDLAIDGVKIKKEDFGRYKPIVDKIETMRADMARNTLLKQKIANGELLNQQQLLNQKLLELQARKENNVQLDQQKDFLNQKLLEMDLQNSDKLLALTDLNSQQADLQNKMLLLAKERSRLQYGSKDAIDLREQGENLLRKVERSDDLNRHLEKLELAKNERDLWQEKNKLSLMNQKLALQDFKNQQLLQLKASQDLVQNQKMNQLLVAQDQQFHNSNHELASILADLAAANVIADKERFSFSLDNDALIVDGKKQPASLHNELRKKYIKHKNDHYIYKTKPHSRSTDIYVE